MATVALMAVALIPLLEALTGSLQAATQNQRQEIALDVAASRLAWLHSRPFTTLPILNGQTQSPPRDPLGRSLPHTNGMTLRTQVEWVSLGSPGGRRLPPDSTPLLRLGVTVSWDDQSVKLTSLQARLVEQSP